MKITRELRSTIVLMLDSYKLSHRLMYPKNTVMVYSNATPRTGKRRGGRDLGYVIAAGAQRVTRKLKDEFDVFFNTPWETLEPFLLEQLKSFTGTDYDVSHLKELHDLGYIPMVIKALPEGTRCPYGVPYMTMYNTLPKFFWLTNYLETWLSSETWNIVTATTTAHQFYNLFSKWAIHTTGNADMVSIQGHDFSLRGTVGVEAGSISGIGHLMAGFVGSDTVPAYLDAQYYYDSGVNDWDNFPKGIVSTSVPASEHSVQCSHYNPEAGEELAYLDHMLDTFPTGVVSIVCDGFDFWSFITDVLPLRKDKIMARDGKVVIRPDSGDPVDIICGLEYIDKAIDDTIEHLRENGVNAERNSLRGRVTPEYKGAIEVLWEIFGGTTNDLGYKELDSHIGLIYGDAITLDRVEATCARLEDKKFASTNWVAGIGSFTYQMVTRDTDGQAFKATYIELVDNFCAKEDCEGGCVEKWSENCKYGIVTGKEIFKDPKTGDGTKKSAKGLLAVYQSAVEGVPIYVHDQCTWEDESQGILTEVFRDGKLLNQTTIQEIRTRINETTNNGL